MNFKSKIFILGLITKIYAAKFSVISFEGSCLLNVGGQLHEMIKEHNSIPLYTTTVDVQPLTTYNYICGSVNDIERVLMGDNTHNELIGRATTIYDMPEFGYPNTDPWTRSIGRTELFDPDYVPTVIIDTDENYFVDPNWSGEFNKVIFILKDNVFKFKNVKYTSKNFDQDKFQFEIVDLPDGGIYGRDDIKFRPSAYDPVFFRQMLYGDIAHAIGNPAHESVAARVYTSSGTPIGLYVLQENCASESFIKSAFYGNPETQEISGYKSGSDFYDCSTGADFTNVDLDKLGAFQNKVNPGDLKINLQELNDRIEKLNVNDADAINTFSENFLDLDTLFRALALEYLTGHWDSYWFLTSNFVVFHPPEETEGTDYNHTKLKYYFIDQDFDQTFGSNMREELDARNYPMKSYTEYVGKDATFWKSINTDEEYDWGSRVLLNKFLGCDGQASCITKEYFENHLKSIVQHIFNPVAIERKTNGYKGRLAEEIKWDCSIPRLHTGTCAADGCKLYKFTYEDFERGIVGPTETFVYGILDWVSAIAEGASRNFNIKIDTVPYDPSTASETSPQKIEAGSEYNSEALFNGEKPVTTNKTDMFNAISSTDDSFDLNSGSVMTTINIGMLILTTILSVVLIF